VLVPFDQITGAHLRDAFAVAAVDARHPGRELPLYPAPRDRRPGPPRADLIIAVDPRYRDEQVRYLRDWFAASRPTPEAGWATPFGPAGSHAG
jgi:hypothetical protein